jgi:hypothetical protein
MIPSPCINVCRMDAATGWCEGCQRTLQEIGAWSGMADAEKRAVWQALPARQAAWLSLHPELRVDAAVPAVPGPAEGDAA